MKSYPTYKPTNIEWIGDIPEHWDKTKLKHLVEIKITDGPHETPELIDEGVPFLSAESIKESKLDFNARRGNISRELFELFNKKSQVKKNDILFCKSGSTTGKSAMVETDDEFSIWSPLAIIRGNKMKVNQKYLFHFIQSREFQTQVQLFWSFGTQPNIGMNTLENLHISFPVNVEEQTAIANYLDQKTALIDTLIADKHKLIELFKEERIAIINEAVSGEGMGWERKKLKYVAKVVSGAAFNSSDFSKDGNIRVMKISNIQHDYIDWTDLDFVPDELQTPYEKFRVINGDIVFALTRPIISTGIKSARAYFNDNEIVLLNQRNAILRVGDKIDATFMYFVTHSNYFFKMFELSIDYTGQQPNISPLSIMNFEIILPPLKEQSIIVKYIQSETQRIDETVSIIEKEIEFLQEYRTALISEVVTGKIDVREKILNKFL